MIWRRRLDRRNDCCELSITRNRDGPLHYSPESLPDPSVTDSFRFLDTPALARLYAHILRHGPVTVSEIVDQLDVPQGTGYDYVQKLETTGLAEKTREQRPYEYDAEPITLTLLTDGETQTTTPVLIAAVARREVNEDIDVYIERHGLDGLTAALEYAFEYVDGTVTHRIAARELDISPLEAEIVLQALESAAAERLLPQHSFDEQVEFHYVNVACLDGLTAEEFR